MGRGFVNSALTTGVTCCISLLVVTINAWAVYEAVISQVWVVRGVLAVKPVCGQLLLDPGRVHQRALLADETLIDLMIRLALTLFFLVCFTTQTFITSRPFLMSLVMVVVALYLGFLAYLVLLSLRRKEDDTGGFEVCPGEAEEERRRRQLKEPLLLHVPGDDTGS